MTDATEFEQDRALYMRWRRKRPAEGNAPDALTLAAYAEGSLEETAAAPVEAALAADLMLFDDVVFARAGDSPASVPETVLARALDAPFGNVIPFPLRTRRSGFRKAAVW